MNMENKYDEWPKSQRLKKADGTIAYIWDNKLHNWEGPALIPEGNEKKAEKRFSETFTYSNNSNNLNIICNVSKTLNDNTIIDASRIISKVCSHIGGAGGGQKTYATGSGLFKNDIKEIIENILKEIL